MGNIIETRLLSSLVKVFSDEDLKAGSFTEGSVLLDEVYSFQAAYRLKPGLSYGRPAGVDSSDPGNNSGMSGISCPSETEKRIKVSVISGLSRYITVRKVTEVQSDLPCFEDHDEYVLRTSPGLYPDLLEPTDGCISLTEHWQSVWITAEINPLRIEPGVYPIEVHFTDIDGRLLASEVFRLTVIGCRLPKQKLIHTQWFHTDCLATYYNVEVFSEEHWKLIEQYVRTAVKHGINMILTPLFTPPLDTQVGGERPTVQLVEVYKFNDRYGFGFDRLKRWIRLCRANGVEYFEFSHLFTQWGAKHAPKIIANVNGVQKRIFGWDTDSMGPEYENFLDQFLPALVSFIEENNIEKRSYFHVSDEPWDEHFESYGNASRILKKHLSRFPIIDALSDYAFYEKGLVRRPIPATNHIEPFLEHKVPDLWTYYCCGQYQKVANRFFNMPSARNRILGIQLYKFNIAGFLQWGYNFWYTQGSVRPVDPFKETDAGKAFPSGDAFMVYPGGDGPLESIRFEVFREALQDLRALNKLEELIGREAVVSLIDKGLDSPVTFSEYPRDDKWLLTKRKEINDLIAEKISAGRI